MVKSLEEVLGGLKDETLRRAEIVEPWHSYWYHRPLRNFPPKLIQFPHEYDGSERLSLACTQTGLPSKKQREIVGEWCELLPTLSGVRILWFHSKVTQELFEAACGMANLEGLYIKWSSIQDLEPIARLTTLTHLHIGGAPSAKPIEALAGLPKLVDLELSNVRAAEDLAFLERMPGLQSLALSGDGNSLKSLRLASLKPIQTLANLERLQITTATVLDDSLEPIGKLPRLKYLMISNQFRAEEIAKLAGRLPTVECDRFDPIGDPVSWMACKKCGGKTIVSLTGKGKPWLCRDCDEPRISKHVTEFNRIVQSAAKDSV